MISEAEMKGLCHEPAGRRLVSLLRRTVLWFLVVLLVVFIASFFFVSSLAETQLRKLCSGSVYVQSGRMKGLDGIKLKGLIIAADEESLATAPILQADECQVKFSLWGLLTGRGGIKFIGAKDFLLSADYHQDRRHWTFEQLVFSSSEKSKRSTYLPRIDLQQGALRVRKIMPNKIETITTIGFDGAFAAQTVANEYHFQLIVDDRFDCSASRLDGIVSFSETDSSPRLKMTGSFGMHDKTMVNNCWHLDQIQLDCLLSPDCLTIQQCSLNMADGQYQLEGMIGSDTKQMDLRLQIKNGRLSDKPQENTVVYAEPVMSYLPSAWADFLKDYNPAGVVNLDLQFQRKPEDLKLGVFGQINCQDVSIVPRLFPYPLDHLHGDIVFQGRNLQLSQLKTKHKEVDIEIDARFANLGEDVEIDFHAKSPNLALDRDVLSALSQSAKKVWFSFTPSGTTAFDYHFERSKDRQNESVLKLDLLNVSATYDLFPYPLENLTGTVIAESDTVKLDHLVADFEDGRKVQLSGQAFNLNDAHPKFRIEVQGQKIPVDKNLIGAMPKEQRAFLKQFEIDAVADLDVDIFTSETKADSVDYIAKIKLDGKRIFYDRFPLPMDDVHLDVDITEKVVRLHRFEGLTEGGKVILDGTLMPKGADSQRPGACLNMNLKHFDLNETFWQAIGDKADAAIGKLRPTGPVNIFGLLEINASDTFCKATDLKIDFMDNPLVWDGTQHGRAKGSVQVKDDVLLFEDFSINDVSLATLPDELLAGKLKRLHSQVRPQGQMSVMIEQGKVQIQDGALASLDVTGGIDLQGVSGGQKVKNITGGIDAHLEMDDSKTWRALAKYDIDDFLYRDWNVSDLTGQLTYDPGTKKLESHDFTADFYKGTINGSFDMDLSDLDKAAYTLKTTYENVDINTFLMAGRETESPKVYKGLAQGLLDLQGNVDSLRESQGKLVINAKDLQLGTQSLLGKVLTTIQLKRPENFMFSEVEFDSVIDGPELVCERVRIVGKPLVFYGNGTLNLDERQIQASLVGLDKIVGKEENVLNMLARGIGSALWKIEISGDINDPKVDTVYMSVLKQPLNIFKKKNKES